MVCVKCGSDFPDTEFYRNDKSCKECRKAMVRLNRASNLDKYREYEKTRKNKRERAFRGQIKYRKAHRDKYLARTAVSNALRDGRLTRDSCAYCGSKAVEAHHSDYSKPLDVLWVCKEHHKAIHIVHGIPF